ncbi:MAG: hypothetical protein IJS19_02880 [Muribaculaceae bacterium]|nr:hypothetical protein [Muribaculaceae bacterium]
MDYPKFCEVVKAILTQMKEKKDPIEIIVEVSDKFHESPIDIMIIISIILKDIKRQVNRLTRLN